MSKAEEDCRPCTEATNASEDGTSGHRGIATAQFHHTDYRVLRVAPTSAGFLKDHGIPSIEEELIELSRTGAPPTTFSIRANMSAVENQGMGEVC